MYRLTNTNKWHDAWYSDLTPHAKLLFTFLCENCDNAGVYVINKKFMLFYTGLTDKQLADATLELKKQSYEASEDKKTIWLTNFLKHQKKLPLNTKNNNHKQIINLLVEYTSDSNKFSKCRKMKELLPFDVKKVVIKREVEIIDTPTQVKPQVVEREKPPVMEVKKLIEVPKAVFKKPTMEQVEVYLDRQGFVDGKEYSVLFWKYFESKSWMVGNAKMSDWASACDYFIANRNQMYNNNKKTSKMESLKKSHDELSRIDWNEYYSKEKQELKKQKSLV